MGKRVEEERSRKESEKSGKERKKQRKGNGETILLAPSANARREKRNMHALRKRDR